MRLSHNPYTSLIVSPVADPFVACLLISFIDREPGHCVLQPCNVCAHLALFEQFKRVLSILFKKCKMLLLLLLNPLNFVLK